MRIAERLDVEKVNILRFIARREERGDPSPGLREICCAAGLEGSRAAEDRLSDLVVGGYVTRDVGWRRMLELTGRGWRLLEGLADAEQEENVLLDAEPLLARAGTRLLLLRAAPESLVRAGMSETDLLAVDDAEWSPAPAEGELVAVRVGGETVLKRVLGGGELAAPLREAPEDPGDGPCGTPRGEPPIPASAAEILGRVVYVVRPLAG